jgi:hypothetical protein
MGDYTLEFMAAANRGAVALPDLPGTLLDAVLNLAGTDIRTPKLRNAPGIRQGVAGNFAPDGPLKDATKFAGEVVGGSVVPMAATAKLADRLGKATSGIASTAPRFIGKGAAAPVLAGKIPTVTAGAVKAPSLGVIQSAAASPSAFLTKEATATALFAAGGGTGAALTENDPLASMAFGLAAATLPGRAGLANTAISRVKETGKQVFSKKAARGRAIALIREHADDFDVAVSTLDKNLKSGKQGTLAQLTDDKGIAALEKHTAAAAADDFGARVSISDAKVEKGIINGLDEIIDASSRGAAQSHIASRVRSAKHNVQQVLDKHVSKVKSVVSASDSGMDIQDAGRIISTERDSALKTIKDMEIAAYRRVPKDIRIATQPIKQVVKDVNAGMTATNRRSAMPEIKKELALVKAIDGNVSPQELVDLRSAIGTTLRDREFTNGGARHMLNEIQGSIKKVLDSGEAGAAYKAAAAITNRKHSLFYDGPYAKAIMSKSPETAGRGLLSASAIGEGGGLADDLVGIATETGINLAKSTDDLYRVGFFSSAKNADGTINQNAAAQFAKKHASYLRRNPELLKEFQDIEALQRTATKFKTATDNGVRAIEKGRSALYSAHESPVKAVDMALRSKNTNASVASLVREAKRDSSGAALNGLKRDFMDHFLSKMTRVNASGETVLNKSFGSEFAKNKQSLSQVLSPDELKSVASFIDDARRLFIRDSVIAVKGSVPQDVIVNSLGRIAGAKIGAQVGVTPLISAGIGRNLADKVFSKIPQTKALSMMEDLMLNPQNGADFADHLARATTVAERRSALNAWVIASGANAITGEEVTDDDLSDLGFPLP